MLMKCISVYTDKFELFSDIFEEVINCELEENEEKCFAKYPYIKNNIKMFSYLIRYPLKWGF